MTGIGIYNDENKGFCLLCLLSKFCCRIGLMKGTCVPAPGHTITPTAINGIGFYTFKGRHKITKSMGLAH